MIWIWIWAASSLFCVGLITKWLIEYLRIYSINFVDMLGWVAFLLAMLIPALNTAVAIVFIIGWCDEKVLPKVKAFFKRDFWTKPRFGPLSENKSKTKVK